MLQKKIILFFYTLFSLSSFVTLSQADEAFTGKDEILKGIHLTYQMDFSGAQKTFSLLKERRPDSLATVFYPGVLEGAKIEVENRWRRIAGLYAATSPPKEKVAPKIRASIMEKMKKTIHLCKEILKKDPDNFEALFYKAAAFSYRAKMEYYDSNYFSIIKNIKKSTKIFYHLIEIYPERGDAYLAPGINNYFIGLRSRLSRFFLWFLGFSGSKEKGLLFLQKAFAESTLSTVQSADFLAFIHWRFEKDFITALAWADTLEKALPGTIFPEYHRVAIYHHNNNIQKEEESLTNLRRFINDNAPDEIKASWDPLLLFALGKVRQTKGLIKEAEETFSKALNRTSDTWLKNEIEKR